MLMLDTDNKFGLLKKAAAMNVTWGRKRGHQSKNCKDDEQRNCVEMI